MRQNFEDAEKQLEQVLLLDQSNPSALFGLAQVAGQRQQLDLALDLYSRAAAHAGEKTWIAGWSYLRRGNIFRLREDWDNARAEWSQVLLLEGDLRGAETEAKKALSQVKP
jgi:tetratricopeptide (TPR) repeat protein